MADIVITERKDIDFYSRINMAAVDENGTALSKGVFKLVNSSYGQGTVKTLLAGGIGTPVHYRRGGNVRKMFDVAHRMAIDEGASVALLHPFSFAYYRNFGYEKVSDHLIVRFPTRLIDFVPRRCNFVPYDETKLADVISIYEKFAHGRNLLLQRFDDRRYVREGEMSYICYDGGEPVAYIVYSTYKRMIVNHMGDSLLTVHELAYTSPDALREIFSFLRMFEGEYDEIEFANCAMCPEVDILLRHYTHTAYTLVPDIMARVLDTEKMLSANAYPSKEGAFTVKIGDDMPSVAGAYRVEYGGGENRVKVLDSVASADITLSAGAFARLIYGYDGVSEAEAKYMDGVQLDGDAEAFFSAFPKRPCGIFEHF